MLAMPNAQPMGSPPAVAAGRQPGQPTAPGPETRPGLDDDHARAIEAALPVLLQDPVFARAVADHALLPERKRHGLARFLKFCEQRTGEERAAFVLWQHPEWTDAEVAEAVGVARETLSTWPGYRAFKARLLGSERASRRDGFTGRMCIRIDQGECDE
jgi:DNA-directed RNA polymerase specialized sigma24 family protein